MAKELLNVSINVGDEKFTVGELVKMLKTSRQRQVKGNKLVITTRANKQIEINVKQLSTEQALALFSNGFEKVEGFFSTYIKELEKTEVPQFYENLTSRPSSQSRVSSYVNPTTVAQYFASLNGNYESHRGTLGKLTPAQAGLVLKESFDQRVEAAQNDATIATDPLTAWSGLSESAKYSPDTFKEIILDAGTPLFANSRKYRKLVNKDKLVAAISTASKEEIKNIINTFGSRSIFSDELTVGKIIDALKAEGLKTGKMDEAIEKIKDLGSLVGEYKTEAVAIGDFTVEPAGVDKKEYDKFLAADKKDVNLGKNELSATQKENIRNVILGLDTSKFKTKEDLEQYLQKHLEKTNVNRLFADRAFVRQLMTGTLSARAVKDFYYGSWDKKTKTNKKLSVDEIKKSLGGVGSLMYDLMQDKLKVLDPLKSLDAEGAIKKLAKAHPGIDANFSENAKLSQKAKAKFLKKVAKGKFDGKKGQAKFDKFVNKNLVKITSDKDFVNEVLSTLEEKAYSEVLNHSLDAKLKKGKKVQTKTHTQMVLDNNKVLFDSLVNTYDTELVKADQLVKTTEALKQDVMTSEIYKQQVLRNEKLQGLEVKEQDNGPVMEKK